MEKSKIVSGNGNFQVSVMANELESYINVGSLHDHLYSIHFDVMFDDENIEKFYEQITNDTIFLSRAMPYLEGKVYTLYAFEYAQSLVERGYCPSSLAHLFALIYQDEVFDHAENDWYDVLLSTGASIQIDNVSQISSPEIFALVASRNGIDAAKRWFEISGMSIQEQQRHLDTFIGLSEVSVDNLLNSSNDSIIATLRLLSIPNLDMNECDVLSDLTSDFTRNDWMHIGQTANGLANRDDALTSRYSSISYDDATNFPTTIITMNQLKSFDDGERANKFYFEVFSVATHKLGLDLLKKSYNRLVDHVCYLYGVDYVEDQRHYDSYEVNQKIGKITFLHIVTVAANPDFDCSLSLSIAGFESDPREW